MNFVIEPIANARRAATKMRRYLASCRYNLYNTKLFREVFESDYGDKFPFGSAVFHAQGLASDFHYTPLNRELWNSICRLFFCSRSGAAADTSNLTIITCTNDPSPGVLQQSLEHLEFDSSRFHILGREYRNWQNFFKIEMIRKFLPSVKTPYILYCDSHDVLVTRVFDLVDSFLEFQCEMLCNAEKKICHPKDYNRAFERETACKETGKNCDFPYLNSGVWIAKTDFARHFFEECAKGGPEPVLPSDEQVVFKRMFRNYYPQIKLDYERQLFQTMQFANVSEVRVSSFGHAAKSRRP